MAQKLNKKGREMLRKEREGTASGNLFGALAGVPLARGTSYLGQRYLSGFNLGPINGSDMAGAGLLTMWLLFGGYKKSNVMSLSVLMAAMGFVAGSGGARGYQARARALMAANTPAQP